MRPADILRTILFALLWLSLQFWLLWGTMVYSGGVIAKVAAIASASAAPGSFAGWETNVLSLAGLAAMYVILYLLLKRSKKG